MLYVDSYRHLFTVQIFFLNRGVDLIVMVNLSIYFLCGRSWVANSRLLITEYWLVKEHMVVSIHTQ